MSLCLPFLHTLAAPVRSSPPKPCRARQDSCFSARPVHRVSIQQGGLLQWSAIRALCRPRVLLQRPYLVWQPHRWSLSSWSQNVPSQPDSAGPLLQGSQLKHKSESFSFESVETRDKASAVDSACSVLQLQRSHLPDLGSLRPFMKPETGGPSWPRMGNREGPRRKIILERVAYLPAKSRRAQEVHGSTTATV